MDAYLKGKSNSKQVTLPYLVKDRIATCLAICRFFYAHAIPFHLVKSPLFKKMMDLVANYGKGLKLSTYRETGVTFLKKEVENMHFTLDKYKNEWKKTSCTLMLDGWMDNRERSITNFLVNSPK